MPLVSNASHPGHRGYYEGEYKNGKRHGEGRQTCNSVANEDFGAEYDGMFENDVPHGTGRCTYIDGSSYYVSHFF